MCAATSTLRYAQTPRLLTSTLRWILAEDDNCTTRSLAHADSAKKKKLLRGLLDALTPGRHRRGWDDFEKEPTEIAEIIIPPSLPQLTMPLDEMVMFLCIELCALKFLPFLHVLEELLEVDPFEGLRLGLLLGLPGWRREG